MSWLGRLFGWEKRKPCGCEYQRRKTERAARLAAYYGAGPKVRSQYRQYDISGTPRMSDHYAAPSLWVNDHAAFSKWVNDYYKENNMDDTFDVIVGRFENSADDYEYTCLVKKQSNTLVGDKVMRANWSGPLTVTKVNPPTAHTGRTLKVAKLHSRKQPETTIGYVGKGDRFTGRRTLIIEPGTDVVIHGKVGRVMVNPSGS